MSHFQPAYDVSKLVKFTPDDVADLKHDRALNSSVGVYDMVSALPRILVQSTNTNGSFLSLKRLFQLTVVSQESINYGLEKSFRTIRGDDILRVEAYITALKKHEEEKEEAAWDDKPFNKEPPVAPTGVHPLTFWETKPDNRYVLG